MTATLMRICDDYKADGYHVITMAGTSATKQNFQNRGFSNVTTIATELRRIKTGLTRWDRDTVLIVEGMDLPSALLAEVRAAGAKLIFATNAYQPASIARSGGSFEEVLSGLPRSTPACPPIKALFLLDLLLAKADRDTIPGDLVEEFETSLLSKYGVRRARFWFWAQAARAIAERNRLSRWVLVYGLGRVTEWIFKAIGS
jgi:hypothetical protein